MQDIDAMRLALEALGAHQPVNFCQNSSGERFPMFLNDPFQQERDAKAIAALRQAIERAEQTEHA